MPKFYIYSNVSEPEMFFVEEYKTDEVVIDLDSDDPHAKYLRGISYETADWVDAHVLHSQAVGVPVTRQYVLDVMEETK